MAHWASMVRNRDSFDVADLPPGRDLTVQITATRGGAVEGFANGKKTSTKCVWVSFAGFERPCAFKATNCKSVVQVYGTGEVEKWIGKWITLYGAMVADPSGGKGALVEAVRVRPERPTPDMIAEAEARLGKKPAAAATPRDQGADMKLVDAVCTDLATATTSAAIEAVLAPHRDELRKMEARLVAIVTSAKKARLAELAAVVAQEAANA